MRIQVLLALIGPYSELLCCILWLLLLTGALLTAFVPQLNRIGSHGKHGYVSSERSSFFLLSYLQNLQVPKSYFIHLYAVGCVVSVAVIIMDTKVLFFRNMGNSVTLCLVMWTAHVFRRLVESAWITLYGESKMHVGGYVAGLVHYIAVPFCISRSRSCQLYLLSGTSESVLRVILFSLYFTANCYQYQAHLILYRLKASAPSVATRYSLPSSSWFRYVCCPHYSCEILIYLCLAMMLPCSPSMWLLLAWVTTNLAVVSDRNLTWYKNKFRDRIPKSWWRICPLIW